jgi:hypothetical protein
MLLRLCNWCRLVLHFLRLFRRHFFAVIGLKKQAEPLLPIAVQHQHTLSKLPKV